MTTPRSLTTAPGRLPVLGHGLQMTRRPREFLLSLQYGQSVTTIQLGRKRVYVINDPELVRQVLRDSDTFGKGGPITERLRLWFGNGLGISDGEFHRRQRALMQPAFHHTEIVRHAALMSDVVMETMSTWQDGVRVPVDREMSRLALTNVTKAMFSVDSSVNHARFLAAVAVVLGGVSSRLTDATGLRSKLPTRANRRYSQAAGYLRRTIDQVIDDYRAGDVDNGDLLSMMLHARGDDGAQAMSDRQLHDEVMTIFIAGAESVGNTLAWVFHELAAHPDVERRLHDEVDRVLAGGPAGYDDIAGLEYTKRVLTETLRLRTQGLALSRFTTRECDLGGYRIPAQAPVLFSQYALNHNPAFHPDPERFDPDRWHPDRAKTVPRGAFIPFGMGNHTCIGEPFALTEMIITLATVAARWRLRPAPGHHTRPKSPAVMAVDSLPMIPHRRQRQG